MDFNKQAFIEDLSNEATRVFKLIVKARNNGKKSKAQVNSKKLAAKYNLPYYDNCFVQIVGGLALMQCTFSNDPERDIEVLVNNHLHLITR